MSGLSQLRAALRLVARGYAGRGRVPPPPAAPRRRQAVERGGLRADRAAVARYLDATAGQALAGADALPPLFHTTWETGLALELLSNLEPALPLGAVVHAGSEILVPRPPRRDGVFRCRVELERLEPAADGLRLEVVARNWAQGDLLCTESRHRFRIRTGRGAPRGDRAPVELAGWTRAASWRLPGGAGRRFARASGDWNPIHLWPWTARPLGFRRPILHGFATAAMVAHAVCQRAGAAPVPLGRFAIAFRAPLALPGEAELWLHAQDGFRRFRVLDPSGERLFAEGEVGGG